MSARSKSKPVILIDSREQRPWAFNKRVCTDTASLPAGDYSLKGFELQVAVERKSFEDLVNTVVHERERFGRELAKLKVYRYSWIVVEGSIEDIVSGSYRSRITPQSLLGIVTSLMTDFIPVVFAGDRVHAAITAEALLLRAYKRLQNE
ncbi:MAG: ERCC4 domain-containing protein [bacterium]